MVFPLATDKPELARVAQIKLVSGASRQAGNPLILLVIVRFPFADELYIRSDLIEVCEKAVPAVLVSDPIVIVVELLAIVIAWSKVAVAQPAPVPFSNE